jgi:hypothetical protein
MSAPRRIHPPVTLVVVSILIIIALTAVLSGCASKPTPAEGMVETLWATSSEDAKIDLCLGLDAKGAAWFAEGMAAEKLEYQGQPVDAEEVTRLFRERCAERYA